MHNEHWQNTSCSFIPVASCHDSLKGNKLTNYSSHWMILHFKVHFICKCTLRWDQFIQVTTVPVRCSNGKLGSVKPVPLSSWLSTKFKSNHEMKCFLWGGHGVSSSGRANCCSLDYSDEREREKETGHCLPAPGPLLPVTPCLGTQMNLKWKCLSRREECFNHVTLILSR